MSAHALAPGAAAPAASTKSSAFAGALLLPAATGAAGVLTYAFLVLAARALGPAAYGRIGALWGAMFLAAIVLFRPLEQLVARSLSERLANGLEVTSVVRAAVKIWAGGVVLVAVVAAVAWPVLDRRLFESDSLLTAFLIVGVVVYGCEYLVRGLLSGVRWFAGYGIGLLADAGTRLAIALPLFFVGSRAVAAAAVAGAGFGGAIVPLVLGRAKLRNLGGTAATMRLRSTVGFTAPAAVVAASDQLLVNGAPLLVLAAGADAKEAGVVFAATMLVRMPVYVFQGLAAALLPNFTHVHVTHGRAQLRAALRRVTGVLAVVGAVVAVGGALAGPAAMRVVYGASFHARPVELGLLSASVGAYLLAATLSQALLATHRLWGAASAWTTAAGLFVATYAVASGTQLFRVSLGLLVALVFLTAAVAWLLRAAIGGSE